MTSDLTPEQMLDVVRPHVTALMEHFEAVQIHVSICTPNGTEHVNLGAGNWFARQGMAQDFINQDRAHTEANEIAKAIPPQE
jgi:hypothetical protein